MKSKKWLDRILVLITDRILTDGITCIFVDLKVHDLTITNMEL
jgi:hypothetical protein